MMNNKKKDEQNQKFHYWGLTVGSKFSNKIAKGYIYTCIVCELRAFLCFVFHGAVATHVPYSGMSQALMGC